ncbi:MAG: DUF2764 family protein [Lentisphaeria bacterium]|nr:DUF2764 family protein [Lentisphaeria bacterium]
MSEYPYLAALLPMLYFDSADFPSRETFLGEAEKWLPEDEYAALSTVAFDDVTDHEHPLELVEEYRRFERAVRRDIATFIESRRQGHDHKTTAFPHAIIKDNDPLAAEKQLLRLRWDFVSSRLNTHFWDLHALVVYHLQIQILERLSAFDLKEGEKRFKTLTSGVGKDEETGQN